MVFGPSHVLVGQEFVVPEDAQYLLFDSWVAGFGTLHVALGDPNQPDIVVTSGTAVTYALPLAGMAGQHVVFAALGRDTDVGDNNYAYLDNVRFSDIPEPGTLTLCATGALAVCALGRAV